MIMSDTKKYTGTDMSEILDRIRIELGKDAIIFKSSSRKTGFNGKTKFEVIAGRDSKTWESFMPKRVNNTDVVNKFLPDKINPVYKKIKNIPVAKEKELEKKEFLDDNSSAIDNDKLFEEIKELKNILKYSYPQARIVEDEKFKKIRSHLLNNGVEFQIADDFVTYLKKFLGKKINKVNFSQVIQIARVILSKKLKQKSNKKNDLSRIHVLVGPTGVGKTTTLAKLSSIDLLKNKSKVALVSLDSYRLGAHAQLKAYADILSVPFYSATSKNDLLRIIQNLPNTTKIYIDTSGLSPLNTIGINKLTNMFKNIKGINISLVVSAGYQLMQTKSILDKFSVTDYNNIILSKTDEVSSFGHLLSLFYNKDNVFSFFTNGQEVPKDIMKYSATYLAEKILQVDN